MLCIAGKYKLKQLRRAEKCVYNSMRGVLYFIACNLLLLYLWQAVKYDENSKNTQLI